MEDFTNKSTHSTVGKQCPNCAHIRGMSDEAAAWQCPKCHMAYNKISSEAIADLPDRNDSISFTSIPIMYYLFALFLALAFYYFTQNNSGMVDRSVIIEDALVVVYTTKGCKACNQAKSYLNSRNILFTEYDVRTSDAGFARYQKMGAGTLPIVLVTDKRMDGFDKRKMAVMLKNVGLN